MTTAGPQISERPGRRGAYGYPGYTSAAGVFGGGRAAG